MELVNFSVTNYRSITSAHKVSISNMTTLIGRNNEGKSNILKALDVGMISLQRHSRRSNTRTILTSPSRRDEKEYLWDRDFPVALQSRKSGTQTIIRFEFQLSKSEVDEFRSTIGQGLNGILPIIIKIGKDSKPQISISKSGKGSKGFNQKSTRITEFIAEKINFNYIPAIRSEQEAMNVVSRLLSEQLRSLEDNPSYMEALDTIRRLQIPYLEALSNNIREPLEEFLPGIKAVTIEMSDSARRVAVRRDFEIIIDDGTPTSLSFKGDGVKSLVALGLLKGMSRKSGASIIAIEEPESHLHPAAIHQLNEIIKSLCDDNQVVITTHNPLFVERQDIKSNIIVDKGKATAAKNIQQIRDLLGVRASDNLTNASYVLVVEGSDDLTSLRTLLPHLSEKLKKCLSNNLLVIEPIGGAGNLPYKLSSLKSYLCAYHCFLDHDAAGKQAFEAAERDGLASIKTVTFTTCNGSAESEFEDCIEKSIYELKIKEIFGVTLDNSFKGKNKWSDRLKNSFQTQGKLWNDKVESQAKQVVADAVSKNPQAALNQHKRNSIDALVIALETLIKS